MSASWLPTLGSGVQEDQVYILILRKLCLSSPGPFQLKGERKRRVSWAKKGNLTHTAQNQVMSLWALCTVATINTWKAFDSHISKTRHKAHASLFPQTGPHGRGGGAVTKAPFSSGKAVLIRPPRGDITESLHRNEGSYSIRSQRPLREGLLEHRSPEGQQKCVSQTTLFYREGNWHLRWGFSLAKWIFVYHVSDNMPNAEDAAEYLTSAHSEETVSHGLGTKNVPFMNVSFMTKCKIAVNAVRAPFSKLEIPK